MEDFHMSGKKLCISSLVLGIVGLAFSFFLPVISYACAIPGKKRRKNYSSSAGISLSIVALSIAMINSVLGIVMTVKMFFSGKSEEN